MNRYYVTINGHEYAVKFEKDGTVLVNGESIPIDILHLDERSFSVLVNGKSEKIIAGGANGIYQVQVHGKQLEATVESERTRLLKLFEGQSGAGVTKSEVRAPMPALVIKLEVSVGDEVEAGQGLIILEAMKMENEIKAHSAGRVKEIHAVKGKAVEKGELIMILE